MDVTAIQTFVSSVGFPIAATVALFWYVIKQRESHEAEIEKLTQALNNNTLALQHLVDVGGVQNGKH